MRKYLLVAIGLAASMGLASTTLAQTRTAQSIGVSHGISAAYEIEDEITWSFAWQGDSAAVAAFDTYFTMTVTGGSANAGQVNILKRRAMRDDNKCNFWHGNPLASVSFMQSGRTYTATPKDPGQYAPKTGWTGVGGSLDPIEIPVSGYIAGESVQTKNNGTDAKYSFSLRDGLGNTRVQNVMAHLDHWDGAMWNTVASQAISQTNADLEEGVDFYYSANAGTFGHPVALPSLKTDMMAKDIILSGSLSGRSTWHMHAAKSNFTGLSFFVPPTSGDYRVRIAGEVKGNSGVATVPFDVTVTTTNIGGCN